MNYYPQHEPPPEMTPLDREEIEALNRGKCYSHWTPDGQRPLRADQEEPEEREDEYEPTPLAFVYDPNPDESVYVINDLYDMFHGLEPSLEVRPDDD